MNRERLKEVGIDYEAGVKRFMDDEDLYILILQTFATDPVWEKTKEAYDKNDYETLLSGVHEIKGSSGNANLLNVYENATKLQEILKKKNFTAEELQQEYKNFEKSYLFARKGIIAALAEKD